eukprot:gene11374-9886_t
MVTALAPSGPWSAPAMVPLRDCNMTFCQHDMNLAGVVLPNRSFVGMVKVHQTIAGHSWSEVHSVRAEDWRAVGGYVQSSNDEGGNLFPELAPADAVVTYTLFPAPVWLDEQGHWHALFHSETALDSGAHACSPDGVRWRFTGIAYNNTVAFTDGTAQTFTRRERPHVVFGDPERPHMP